MDGELTGAERPTELEQLKALAAAGAARLRTGAQWRTWLELAERFGDFGFANTMLIWAQCPDAVLIHDYGEWRRLGRQVLRGEDAIRLIAGDRVAAYFDLLQTSGKPQVVRLNKAEFGERRWRVLVALAAAGVDLGDREAVRGWARSAAAVHGGDEMAAAVSIVRRVAAAGELAGASADFARMVEAESVAFLLARRIGLDTGGFVFPDVSSWAGSDPRCPIAATVSQTGQRVLTAAAPLLARIDGTGAGTRRLVTGPRLASADQPRQAAVTLLRDSRPARALAEACRYFAERIAVSWVPEYLARRGFGREVCAAWGIGYAPGGWGELTGHLRALGFSDAVIEASGLAAWSTKGTLYDVFRDRIMFPVRSKDGTITGFLGRAAPTAGLDVPKYLNTRASRLYRKGEMLFGLYEGRDALARGARPVLTEGPMDAVAVTVAGGGRFTGIASCGTSLTAEQVALLDRYPRLIVAFDGDHPGQRGVMHAYELLRGRAWRVAVAELPAGQDPADLLISRGPQPLADLLRKATRPIADVAVDTAIVESDMQHRSCDDAARAVAALKAVAPLVAQVPAGDVARQVARVASRLSLADAVVTQPVTDALDTAYSRPPSPAPRRPPEQTRERAVSAPNPVRPGTASRAGPAARRGS